MTDTYIMSAGWGGDYPDVKAALDQHIPVGTPLDSVHCAAYATIRSFVAAERAGVINGKVDQLLARPAAPATDNGAVLAAIAALADKVDQVAAAVARQSNGGIDTAELAADITHDIGTKLAS